MVAFILSHNRCDSCPTLKMLNKYNYTGEYRMVIDDTDESLDDYINTYGNNVIVFNKQHYIDMADTAFDSEHRLVGSPLYARMFLEDYVENKGIVDWIELEDDITDIVIRVPNEENKSLPVTHFDNITEIFSMLFDYMHTADIDCLSTSHTGLFIGGYNSFNEERMMSRRIASNIFIRSNGRRFDWKTIFYDDSNTCMLEALRGKLIFSLPFLCRNCEKQGGQSQLSNQKVKSNSMGSSYNCTTQFERSFYGVIVSPSNTKVSQVRKEGNWWMQINVNTSFPKIVSSKYKERD